MATRAIAASALVVGLLALFQEVYAQAPTTVRPLGDIFIGLKNGTFDDVKLAADKQAKTQPKYKSAPDLTKLPELITFEGCFAAKSDNTQLAVFSDDGVDVYIDGKLIHNHYKKPQHLPKLAESLHKLDFKFKKGQTYNIRVDYSNIIFIDPKKAIDIDGCTLFAYSGGGELPEMHVAKGWDHWRQVTLEEKFRSYKIKETPEWQTDGEVRRTPKRKEKDTPLQEEGPYFRTMCNWKIFKMTIEYRALDEAAVPPAPKTRPVTNEHYSNSGIYIFDRYEVQIIDPWMFDLVGKKGVAAGEEIPHDFRKDPTGKNPDPKLRNIPDPGPENKLPPPNDVKLVSNRNQLLPGGMYKLDPPSKEFKNRANKTKEWNKLEMVFCPPKIDPADAAKATGPAQIEVKLNGTPIFLGPIVDATGKAVKGTGSRANERDFLAEGPIFLQSHWGSQVEFRNPVIEELKACPFDKK